jgi:hypothetical protein
VPPVIAERKVVASDNVTQDDKADGHSFGGVDLQQSARQSRVWHMSSCGALRFGTSELIDVAPLNTFM